MTVRKDFETVRSIFFPRWDRLHKWLMQDIHPDCAGSAIGRCDETGKAIVVRNGSQETLIHEIAHAVTNSDHGKKWQSRMEKAALRAEEIGRKDLADEIRKDYTAYSDPNRSFKPTAEIVYNQVENAILGTHGKLSFEDVIEFVANDSGMTSKLLLSKYNKLRSVYDEALNCSTTHLIKPTR